MRLPVHIVREPLVLLVLSKRPYPFELMVAKTVRAELGFKH
jgi:hypothetical protein